MNAGKDIILVVDYHSQNIEFRWFNEATGEERTGRYPTTRAGILRQVEQAAMELSPGGRIAWIMESTTGWARVKDLLGGRVEFVLANVLQMPLPPKGKRRKSDKIDTDRMLREYMNRKLPRSFQPSVALRQARRVVDYRQELVRRQTAIKNWIGSLLRHETWEDSENLWSGKGLARLEAMKLSESDRMLVGLKLEQLRQVQDALEKVQARMKEIYDGWPEAQMVDRLKGIGMIAATSLLAHIGPIERFPTADSLIAYAGLAPGVRASDRTTYHSRIGGGGTDSLLRYLLIEACQWLCKIPRYAGAYERVMKKRGIKVARIVLCRLVLRSIHKMLTDRIQFNPMPSLKAQSQDAFTALGLPAGKEKARIVSEPSPLCSRRLGARVARQRCPVLPDGL